MNTLSKEKETHKHAWCTVIWVEDGETHEGIGCSGCGASYQIITN